MKTTITVFPYRKIVFSLQSLKNKEGCDSERVMSCLTARDQALVFPGTARGRRTRLHVTEMEAGFWYRDRQIGRWAGALSYLASATPNLRPEPPLPPSGARSLPESPVYVSTPSATATPL